MQQSITTTLQPEISLTSSFLNEASQLISVSTSNSAFPSSSDINAVFGRENIDLENNVNVHHTLNEQSSLLEIKQEEFFLKKEDLNVIKRNSFGCSENPDEIRMKAWLDLVFPLKWFNFMSNYSLVNGLFMQHMNFLQEFRNNTTNLQLIQTNNNDHNRFQERKNSEKLNGAYTKEQRLIKIQYYKEKKNKWRAKHPINRGFAGRKMVAKAKPRIRGKFVKRAANL